MTAPVLVIARKEVRDAQRNRWFLLYAAAFAALALGLARLALGTGATAGLAGFGRTAASLVNLVLLTVPLMGLSLGAASLAAEREAGTMATLMAQPVLPGEVLLGKFIGLSASLGAAVAIGFGLAGAVVAYGGGAVGAGTYAALVGLSLLLGLA
ncbi:MAG: ABC transporter permease, partial [Anaerolineae bacterium]